MHDEATHRILLTLDKAQKTGEHAQLCTMQETIWISIVHIHMGLIVVLSCRSGRDSHRRSGGSRPE